MVFKRKIYDKLLEWKNVSHGQTAAMLEGARRIGKSTIAEFFAQNEYDDYMILDFARESFDVKQNFVEHIGDLDTFFRNLFLLKEKVLPEKKSVIILDEVQMFPLARQAIKYLVQDGRYDYIETGSLISIKKNVKDILIPSEEYKIKMFPMDFEEFLWAKNDTITAEAIRSAFTDRKSMGDAIHRKIMQTFRTYLVVGGMPQAVHAFVEGKSYKEIDFVKRSILSLYEDDLKKYDEANKEKASVIFKTIPEQLENHNSHFKFSLVDKNARYKHYVDSVDFLAESMIGNVCIGVTAPEVSLEAYADRSNFKLYMGDTGLLVTQMLKNSDGTSEGIYKALIFDKLGINQIYYNAASTESTTAYSILTQMLDSYEGSLSNKFDINPGEEDYNLATDKDTTGSMFASMLPMLLLIFLYSGCTSVAPESIAGEKERGTIATLLITPIRRGDIAIGKIMALSLMALMSGASSTIGTILSLPKMMGDEEGMEANVYQVTDYLLLALVILSTVMLLIAVISIISAFAKSIKEAQTYVMPLMVIVMLVGITAMFGEGAKEEMVYYLIPLYNSVQSMVGIFSFKSIPIHIVLTVVSNLAVTGIGIFVLTRMFHSEKVMFTK